MRIKNNISAPNSSRNRGIMQEQLGRSLEKLSSGYWIDRAGDDAAGLIISEGVHHQINGLDQAMKDINDGTGMTRIGEGALAKARSILHRMKTLATQVASGAYSSTTRASIKEERLQLLDEIDQISANTDFNQIPLFDMEVPAKSFGPPKERGDITLQIGHTQEEGMSIARYHISSKALKLDKIDFKGAGKVNASVEYTDKAIQAVTTVRSSFSAAEDRLRHTHNSLGVTRENMTAYESGVRDTNMAGEVTRLISLNIVGQAVQSVQAHSNSLPKMMPRLLQA